jgi:GR25 family glycosyltransferase involved in LPS biosynthesis
MNGTYKKIQRIRGVEGKNCNELLEYQSSVYKNIMPSGAFGCGMSHIKAWETLVKNGDSYSLILEDDVILHKNFSEKFNKVKSKIPDDFYICYLGCHIGCNVSKKYELDYSVLSLFSQKFKKRVIKINDDVFVPSLPLATHAYILSNKGARYLLECFKKDKLHFHVDAQILKYIYNVPSYALIEKLARQEEINIYTSNNTDNVKYPEIINSFLSFKDLDGVPMNYKLCIPHWNIYGFDINFYVYFFIFIGFVSGLLKKNPTKLFIVFNIIEGVYTKFKMDYKIILFNYILMMFVFNSVELIN